MKNQKYRSMKNLLLCLINDNKSNTNNIFLQAAYDDWNNSTPNGWDNNDFVQAQANPVTDFHHDSNSEKRNGDSSTPVGDEVKLFKLKIIITRNFRRCNNLNRCSVVVQSPYPLSIEIMNNCVNRGMNQCVDRGEN